MNIQRWSRLVSTAVESVQVAEYKSMEHTKRLHCCALHADEQRHRNYQMIGNTYPNDAGWLLDGVTDSTVDCDTATTDADQGGHVANTQTRFYLLA